ncbi:MAG: hypothetical protein IJO20_08980 [Ruminococcus sp.]|nr:hypothetical protein [Ruminococcus sp.]MBQ7134608.1 hypothetical protein [Ruminococcus sp.]
MSRKNSRKKQSASKKQAKLAAKKQAKMFALQKNITIFAMLILLVVGLVSTTFSAFIPQQSSQKGSLVAEIQTNTVKQREKEDLADTSANVDIAQSKANIAADTYFYFDNSTLGWTNNCIQLMVGHSSWSQGYQMTQISNTNLYYVKMPKWDGLSQLAVFGTDGEWGGEGNSVSHRKQYAPASTSVLTVSSNLSGYRLLTANSSATLTNSSITSYTSLNLTQTIYVRSASYGSTTYSNDAKAGTAKISGYYVSSATGTSSSNVNTTSSNATTNSSFARSSTITLTATANSGYTFKGWYNSSGTSLSTSATYTVNKISSATSYYARFEKNPTFTVTAGTGGTVSPESGTASPTTGVSITATPSTGYTFANWTGLTNATLSSTTSATTTLKPTADNASVKAIFRPNTPSALTLTASNVASGTSGTGTKANPYIVFKNGGFTLTPTSTVPTGSVAHYSTASSSGYSANNKTFNPSVANIAADVDNPLSYTVYAKAYANSIYSTNPKSATAYYLVFNHLNGANTGFTISSDSITDAESISFSNPYVNDDTGAAFTATELKSITQSYQVSTDNSAFSDISGSTWTPNATGTYYFRVKTTNTKTGETVYSTSQTVTVTQSTVYYPITVTKGQGSQNGTVTLMTDGTTITDNQILSNSPLSVSITRPNVNCYFEYLKVNGTNVLTNLNSNITDKLVIENVKSAVSIEYKINVKPTVEVEKPTNALAITFNYYKDGVSTDVSTAGSYYVDYNSTIKYTVAPMNGYYVSSFTGVSLASGSSWSSTQSIGTKANVTANIDPVTAGITQNKTVTVNVDETSETKEGASLTIDGVMYDFGHAAPLNYGVATTLVVTPPEGYYAQVTKASGVDISPSISTDGKATFEVTLKGTNAEYSVKFVANPKIYIEQPQYGSIYINDDSGRYYFNGESVGYGTLLTVNVKKDNQSNTVTNVKINGSSIGTADGSTFSIVADSTATADISLTAGYDNFEGTLAYGYRRIFFTDSLGWGSDVTAHVSNTYDDRDFSKNNFGMTFYYENDYDQNVYYCDIPYDKKYVVFFDFNTSTNYTSTATIDNTCNAFFANTGSTPYPIGTWTQYYSDYVATDRVTSIQQASTSKNAPVTFKYTCDFGDKILSAEVVDGNACTFDFDSGELIITPTENTRDVSLVKVTSAITGTQKYYLIRVENFEITDFSGIRKIYNSSVLNNIQLQTILNGGVLNYMAEYFVSDTNGLNLADPDNPVSSYSYIGKANVFEFSDTLQGYLNNFTLEYAVNSMSGVKFYKVKAQDANGKTATAYQRTLFGTNTHVGDRCFYLYNNTNVDVSKYDIRVCFFNSQDEKIWATMQNVGTTGYYRATIPTGYEAKVNIYLAKNNKFTNSLDYMGYKEYCDYAIVNVPVPTEDTANIVYSVYSINTEGVAGEFVNFSNEIE